MTAFATAWEVIAADRRRKASRGPPFTPLPASRRGLAALRQGPPRLDQEQAVEEDGWPQVDDRQAGPAQHLLGEPLLLLLGAARRLGLAHLREGHLRQTDEGLHAQAPGHVRRQLLQSLLQAQRL